MHQCINTDKTNGCLDSFIVTLFLISNFVCLSSYNLFYVEVALPICLNISSNNSVR